MRTFSVDPEMMTERIGTALKAAGHNYSPRALRARVEGSSQAFEAIRKAGGDPFDSAVRPLMFGRRGTLAVPLAVAAPAAVTPDDVNADELARRIMIEMAIRRANRD